MPEEMNLSVNGQSQVPPGFRFHPTEEELLHYYLRKKVASKKIDLDVIRDVDLNKLEPWDIQGSYYTLFISNLFFFLNDLFDNLLYVCMYVHRKMQNWINPTKRLVLFQSQRQKVSDRDENKPCNRSRILEGNRS